MKANREAAERMGEAASAWLEALAPAQRGKASFPFHDAEERTSWAYFPRAHKGLPFLEMDTEQQKLAHALVARSLSLPAYAKATAIMALESVLNEIEGRRLDALRDPGHYFLSLFNAPWAERWGWRLEGHHVCLNFTIVAGELVSPTPIFLGAKPGRGAPRRRAGHAPVRREGGRRPWPRVSCYVPWLRVPCSISGRLRIGALQFSHRDRYVAGHIAGRREGGQ